jgi:hypothetical protein
VEMWRSLRDRPALRGPWTEAGTPRGQPGGLPTGCPHPCPPAARPSPHFHCRRPGGRDRRHHFDFFPTPLRGCRPCALRLPPFRCRTGTGGGAGEAGGTPSGVPPGGRRGGRKAGQGGGTPPPLGGSDHPPLGGFWRGRGSRPKGGGTPSGGAPRSAFDRAKNAALIDLRERKHESVKNQWVKGGGRVTSCDPGSGHQL